MNKTEGAYANHLELRKITGEIVEWRFEPFKLKLADKTYYNVDFTLIFPDGHIECHETKGATRHWEDDARVKIKVAAVKFTEFTFVGVNWSKTEGYQYEHFKGEKRWRTKT
jgi:hypothetical protein